MTIECPKCQTPNPEDSKFCKECAASLINVEGDAFTKTMETPQEELRSGSTYADRYQIVEELGKGGMGRVFKVFDKEINEKIALKLIKPEIASDKNTIERFRSELKAARKITHKNVCKMFDLNKEKGRYFITMEYIPGEDLKSMIQMTRQLTVGTAISIAKQICEGLAEAHRQGIVHRDLKPNNIMIDKGGMVRIMDFGIARTIKGKSLTGPGVMIGTPEYMSPEQVEGKEIDQRSDIYSLGIILYEMLTGRIPFEGDSPFTVGIKHKSEIPVSPEKFNPRITEDLNRLILKCLEKDKEKRFQSADEVRSALEQIECGMPTTEKDLPRKKSTTSKEITISFNIKKYFILVFIVMAAVFAAVLFWHPWTKPSGAPVLSPGKPTLAVLYFENNTGNQNLEYLRSGLSEWLITDLSQSRFLNVISGDRIFSSLKKLDLLEADKYSSEDLARVANLVYADHVLKGSYIRVGENFVITAMLQKPATGELISSIQARCQGEEEIPVRIDELTKKIKQDLAISPQQIVADIDEEVGHITTTSPEAFKLYIQGRKFHNVEEYRKSIAAMEKAIDIDPQFAMAYRSMGASYNNQLLFSDASKYRKKAFDLKDRLSERERYLIEGEFFSEKEATYAEAIDSYSKLLELYPDDPIGNSNLGSLFLEIEEWDKAIERLEILTKSNDPSPFSVINLVIILRAKGQFDRAQAELEYYRDNVADNAVIHGSLSDHHFIEGSFELALEECDKALLFNPQSVDCKMRKGRIAHAQGDLAAAEEIYQELLESQALGWRMYTHILMGSLHFLKGQYKEVDNQFLMGLELAEKLEEKLWVATYHVMLALSYFNSGNFEKALKAAQTGLESAVEQESLQWQERAIFVKGLILADMGALIEAEKVAEELKTLVDKGINQKLMRDYYQVLGLIELKKENFPQSINFFERAKAQLYQDHYFGAFDCDQALFAWLRAQAYFQAGNLVKAREEYVNIQSYVLGKLYYGDIYIRSFYMLGRIAELQGNTAKAIEQYRKFLGLWKDADPGIAEVEDARSRLAVLQ